MITKVNAITARASDAAVSALPLPAVAQLRQTDNLKPLIATFGGYEQFQSHSTCLRDRISGNP
jgi:hypothetical protein